MSDPVTAPDLVDVIAKALADFRDGRRDGATPYEIDQARAVLAALTEAGNVEWGVENGHVPIDHILKVSDEDAANGETKLRRSIGIPARVVSRIVGPWTGVES